MSTLRRGPGPRPSPQHVLICRKWIRLKNGRILRAEHYGRKAICFWAKPRS